MRFIVTRPAAQAAGWVQALRAGGAEAVSLPLIGIEPLHDTAGIAAAWRSLPERHLVMFVSANAVEQFFAARPAGVAWPAALAAASTGPGTTQALRAAGVQQVHEPDAAAGRLDSEALWLRLQGQPWAGRHVLIVRGEQGRDWLADTLRAHGAVVEALPAYRRLQPRPDATTTAAIEAARADPAVTRWLFSSSEALQHLAALAPGAAWQSSHAWCSHPRIAASAVASGFGHVAEVSPSPAAVLARWRSGG
jgi:uroporphyrinogen-III synthase